jgi:hypothetical protein
VEAPPAQLVKPPEGEQSDFEEVVTPEGGEPEKTERG